MLFTEHVLRLAVGLPALAIVVYGLIHSRDELHPLVWLLAFITAGAPLATGYVWLRSPVFSVLYGLLTYGSAVGFAVRLINRRLMFRYHWPLLILFMTSVVTAFATIALIIPPAIHDMTVVAEVSESRADEDIRETLVEIDASLANLKQEQQNVDRGVQRVMNEMRARAGRIQQLEAKRDKIFDEVQHLENLKALTPGQVAELRDRLDQRNNIDNVLGFLIGIASSVTAALALKFFVSSD